MAGKRYTFKDLFRFLMEKYNENPGKLNIPKYTDINGVKTVSFGVKYEFENEYDNYKYTFVATNEYKRFTFYKNVQISKHYTKRGDYSFDSFKDMYEVIVGQYDNLIREICYYGSDEEEFKIADEDTPLEGLISLLKMEGKFDELYDTIHSTTNRGHIGQISIRKRRDNRENEIRYVMKNIMRDFEKRNNKSFVKEFGFDTVEKSEELLELLFDRKDVRIRGQEIELYVLKFHNF